MNEKIYEINWWLIQARTENVSHSGTLISSTRIVRAIAITASLKASKRFFNICRIYRVMDYSFHLTTFESRKTAQTSKIARTIRGIAFLISHPKLNQRITSPSSTNTRENIVIRRNRGLLRRRHTMRANTQPKTRTPALQNPNWLE